MSPQCSEPQSDLTNRPRSFQLLPVPSSLPVQLSLLCVLPGSRCLQPLSGRHESCYEIPVIKQRIRPSPLGHTLFSVWFFPLYLAVTKRALWIGLVSERTVEVHLKMLHSLKYQR